jgi:hypothetical protein
VKLALTSLAQLLGLLLGAAASIVGWVALAHHWLGMSTETALLAFIAFATCGVTAFLALAQTQRVSEPQLPPERDFYVVTNESYRWNRTTSVVRPNTAKPELGGTIYAYDNLATAEMKYRQLESEHPPLNLEDHDLSYHETFGYDEAETRLWVVYAHSKTEAHDKVCFDDTRHYLAHDGRTDDLLLVTNNESRKEHYLAWWRPLYRAALSAEQDEIEAKMTYDEAIALFGFKELPPPNTIRCEEIEQFNAKLWSKYNQLNAATSDRKASATVNAGLSLISKRIRAAGACGKYGPCTIHVSKPATAI